ncbi:uncharacterized protein DS421_11g333300 [Arachis hypogaea]|nr:uncharacterized protein DS421_11g333300 [Arachis hypogaea]
MEAHYDSSEKILEVNLRSENDPVFQTQTDQSSVNKPTDSMLGLEEESVSDPAQQKMIIVRMETHSQSDPLDITPQPRQPVESTPIVSAAPSKINPPPEVTVALMMITNTTSHEGRPRSEKGKSPQTPILIEELEELVEQIANTRVATALNFAEDKSLPLEKQPADQFLKSSKLLQGGWSCRLT